MDKSNSQPLEAIMDAMDSELIDSNVRKTFLDKKDDDDIDEELDLDFNVVKNLLESVSQEFGIAGPASTLLTKIYK